MAPKRKLSDEQELEIVGCYKAGETGQELADWYEISLRTVMNVLIKHNCPRRQRGPLSKIEDPEFLAEIKRIYLDLGWSQTVIVEEVGVSQPIVSRGLRKLGIRSKRICGARHGMWKGGRTHLNGYVYVKVQPEHAFSEMRNAQGYVAEHRLKMAQKLGRALRADETVHHKNGDKADNRLRNLQLRQGRHGKGVRYQCRSCGSCDVESVRLD